MNPGRYFSHGGPGAGPAVIGNSRALPLTLMVPSVSGGRAAACRPMLAARTASTAAAQAAGSTHSSASTPRRPGPFVARRLRRRSSTLTASANRGEAVAQRRGRADGTGRLGPVAVAAFPAAVPGAPLGQLDHPGAVELAQVVAGKRLADAQLTAELHRRQGRPSQQRQHPQPERVSQHPQPGPPAVLLLLGVRLLHVTTVGQAPQASKRSLRVVRSGARHLAASGARQRKKGS